MTSPARRLSSKRRTVGARMRLAVSMGWSSSV